MNFPCLTTDIFSKQKHLLEMFKVNCNLNPEECTDPYLGFYFKVYKLYILETYTLEEGGGGKGKGPERRLV